MSQLSDDVLSDDVLSDADDVLSLSDDASVLSDDVLSDDEPPEACSDVVSKYIIFLRTEINQSGNCTCCTMCGIHSRK